MGKGISAIEVWVAVPLTLRLVEVNTKTGFSLTAGSYSIRASSTQFVTYSMDGSTSTTSPSISSVTLTRIAPTWGGHRTNNSAGNLDRAFVRQSAEATTSMTFNRQAAGTETVDGAAHMVEVF